MQERYGGEILKTQGWPPAGRHLYNRIGGVRHDFTVEQFQMPQYSYDVQYLDHSSSAEEAETETLPGQVDAMRTAFDKALKDDPKPSKRLERNRER